MCLRTWGKDYCFLDRLDRRISSLGPNLFRVFPASARISYYRRFSRYAMDLDPRLGSGFDVSETPASA